MNELMEGGTDLRREQRKKNKENYYIRFKYFASFSNFEKYCIKEQKNAEECAEKRRENKSNEEDGEEALPTALYNAASTFAPCLLFSLLFSAHSSAFSCSFIQYFSRLENDAKY